MLTETTELRDRLEYNTAYFRKNMTAAGFDIARRSSRSFRSCCMMPFSPSSSPPASWKKGFTSSDSSSRRTKRAGPDPCSAQRGPYPGAPRPGDCGLYESGGTGCAEVKRGSSQRIRDQDNPVFYEFSWGRTVKLYLKIRWFAMRSNTSLLYSFSSDGLILPRILLNFPNNFWTLQNGCMKKFMLCLMAGCW